MLYQGPRTGTGRPRKWKEPTEHISLRLPFSTLQKIDEMTRPGLSRTDVIVSLVESASNAEVAKYLLLIRELKRENKALREEKEELIKLVQRLQDQLERVGGLSSREREARDLRVEIRKILAKYHELKLLELFRRLGYSETGEALMRKAKVFVKRWFVLEGGVFVSKELGVVLEPRSDVGMLGWRVRLSNSVDGSFAAKAEVKADV